MYSPFLCVVNLLLIRFNRRYTGGEKEGKHDLICGFQSLRSSEYSFHQKNPVFQVQWLATKLAEFLHHNLYDLLHLDQMDRAIEQGSVEWYDQILLKCVQKNEGIDGTQLRTFGAIEFQSDLYHGAPKARCYPFTTFHGNHLQVSS